MSIHSSLTRLDGVPGFPCLFHLFEGEGNEDDEDEKVQPRGLFSCLQRSRSAEQPNATSAAAEEPAPAVPSVLTFKEEEAILSWSPPVPVAGECCVCLSTDAPVYKQICG